MARLLFAHAADARLIGGKVSEARDDAVIIIVIMATAITIMALMLAASKIVTFARSPS